MNIAFNAYSLKAPLTGLGHYTSKIAQGLLKSNSIKNVDFFYGSGWSPNIINYRRDRFIMARQFARDCFPGSYELMRYIMQKNFDKNISKADLYHEPNFLAFETNIPTVITVHDLSWIQYPEVHPISRVRAMNKYFEKGLNQSSFLITDSEFIKKEIIKTFGYPTNNIKSIPLGADSSFRPRNLAETYTLLNRYDLKYKKYILVVGTVEPRKNIVTAIEAFMMLPKNLRQKFPLVIVGMRGWLSNKIDKHINSLVDRGEIIKLGYISQEYIPFIYSGASVLVFPSIYEGFGLPPLEAMSSGIPIITSNVSSLPEVVGDAGLLFDPFDVIGFAAGIKLVLTNKEYSQQLVSKSLKQSKKFDWNKCVNETVDIYKTFKLQVKN